MSTWQIEYDASAARWFRKADPQVTRRIRDGLHAVVATGDPRARGKALSGELAGLWRYRIGDYRVICDIQDERLVVFVVASGHRSNIYDL